MKLNAFRNAATLAFSVTFAGGVMAQEPPQPPQPTPTPTPQATRPAPDRPGQENLRSMIGQTVTVSGCLAQDTASGAQPTGASSNFVLTNVQVRSGAPTPGATEPSTPPSSAGTPSAAGGTKIKLKASGSNDLKENLNKRVEVTGRLEAPSGMTDRPGTTPGAPGAPGTPGTPGTPGRPEPGAPGAAAGRSMDAMPELQVSNVRVLAQSCTP